MPREAVVEAVHDWGGGLVEITFVADGPLVHRPGQWLSFRVAAGGVNDKGIWRVFSLCTSPRETAARGSSKDVAAASFRTLVEASGEDSGGRLIADLGPGSRIAWHGPYGEFVPQDIPPASAVFIADGVGIGPVRAMVTSLAGDGRLPFPVTVAQQAAPGGAVPYRREFESRAASDPHLRYLLSAPAGCGPERRPLAELIPALFADPAADQADWYLCGSGRCIDPLREWLKQKGVAQSSVRAERFFD